MLRGDGRDTWSAIAMTWVDQTGAELHRASVPGTSRRPPRSLDDVVPAACHLRRRLRPARPGAAAAQRLARTEVTEAGLTCFDTDRDFTARLHSTLGIGAAGDGNKAVALLGRIQAGQQITTVDALYKTMVLEEPETLATADEVVAALRRARPAPVTRMITARQQVNALTPIREHRARHRGRGRAAAA